MLIYIYLCYYFIYFQLIGGQNECSTPNGQNGQCIGLRSCDSLFSLLIQGLLTADNRHFLQKSQCGYASGQPLVCCPQKTIVRLPEPGFCGISSSKRILGGNETAIDEFPWMALLEYTNANGETSFKCGGSIITNTYVLTAAHCVLEKTIPSSLKLTGVRLGEWDLSTDQDCDKDDCADPVINCGIEKKIVHELYDPSKNLYNDIALIKLDRYIVFTDWIKPICLPSIPQLNSINYDGIVLEVAGWGKTELGIYSQKKLKVSLPGVNLNDCSLNYQTVNNIKLTSSQLCVGGVKGKDSCQGDSGGPLMGQYSEAPLLYWYLAGIVSFGPKICADNFRPGVYTRVSHFIDWINNNLS